MNYKIPKLPLLLELETKQVLKKTTEARSALAEMKGSALNIPNESILISTLSLQEAKDSSAIENIITTHDELFQSDFLTNSFKSLAAKEVHNYADALRKGFDIVQAKGILTVNTILELQEIIEANKAGFRKLPGTALKNEKSGETVYTPPQNYTEILDSMKNLEEFINVNEMSDWDPLIKMAVIHHQFESIHPFYDGNGRTGRIINILYLVKEKLLNLPILYLSRYINQNKNDYYRLLQEVRERNAWEEWVLFILEGVVQTSKLTIQTIEGIKTQMQKFKIELRSGLPKIYNQDLLNNLFRHPYTKIEFIIHDLGVSRPTATRYLEEIVSLKLLKKVKIGKDNYYVNEPLFELLATVNTQDKQ